MVPVLVALMLVLAGARAEAQVSAKPVLYQLESGSSFTRGCYPPCLCPIFTTEDISGTYRLAFDQGGQWEAAGVWQRAGPGVLVVPGDRHHGVGERDGVL